MKRCDLPTSFSDYHIITRDKEAKTRDWTTRILKNTEKMTLNDYEKQKREHSLSFLFWGWGIILF